MRDAQVKLSVDGQEVSIDAGASVLAALVVAGRWCTRVSVSGEPRFALCGMGQCQECRVTIDDRVHRLACQVGCAEGMRVVTGRQAP
jgi:predicted molibdopterin-dependent oxidoreductase YjgC